MAKRFETYQVKPRVTNLADADFWNRIFEEIDLRLHGLEVQKDALQAAVDTFQELALARVNDTLTPILQDALTRLATVGALFEADSVSDATVGLGPRTFVVLEAQRGGYVPTSYLAISSVGGGASMIGKLVSWSRTSGILIVDVLATVGSGTHDDWKIRLSAPPDTEHAGRTDNPHLTSAAQVGAYTTVQTDAAIAGAIAGLLGSAPSALDTLGELATSLGDDGNFAASITAALSARLRVDTPQTLDGPQQAQGRSNLGLGEIATLAVASQAQAQAGVANDVGMTPLRVAQAIQSLASSGLPVGTTIWVNGTVAPAGYIKENGALLSRVTYADLWAYAQASGRVVTDAQWSAGNQGAFSSGDGSTTFRIPDSRGLFVRGLDDGRGVDSGRVLGGYQADELKSHSHAGGVSMSVTTVGEGGYISMPAPASTEATGGTETRPKNISKLACIKY